MKKSQKVLRKRIRENISVLLCLSLLLGVIGFPINVKAADGPMARNLKLQGYNSDVKSNMYLFPGDVISASNNAFFNIVYTTRVPVQPVEKSYDFDGDTLTIPVKLEKEWEYNSYIFEVSYVDSIANNSVPTYYRYTFTLDAFPGFQIIYYDASGNALNSWGSQYYYLDINGEGEIGITSGPDPTFSVEKIADPNFGDQIGWSVSPDYIDINESSEVLYINGEDDSAQIWDDNLFAICMNNTENGILNLYPVFYLAPSTLSVSADNINEGDELSFSIDSNRTDDYSLKFEKKNSDGTFTTLEEAPTSAGDYRVTVIYPETDTIIAEGEYGMEIRQRGFTAISASDEFSILMPNASLTQKPVAYSPTYNGSSQELAAAGKASGGEVLYSLSKDGEYTNSVPKAKDAGKYTVWYMVKGTDGHGDISPASIDVTIAPKTVGLSWSGTEYEYDGTSHCPSAKATGLCSGDSCDVTVIGAHTEAGKYTATAKSLSNSNYALPDANTIEFSITDKAEETTEEEEKDPNKEEGKVSVSMEGFYYGGTATSPVITSSTNDTKNAKVLYKSAGSGDASYSPSVPTEVGKYTVKVTLPSNDKYNACSATADFTINYLPTPSNAYFIRGTAGDGGWYKSDVVISPGQGYQISYGDRNHFSNNGVKIEKNVNQIFVYLRDASTYEQTDVIVINGFKIDKKSPQVEDMTSGEVYFADESGNVTCIVSDENLSHVVIGDNKVQLTDLGNGRKSFTVPTGAKKETVSFTAYDLAGNKTDFSLTTAPSWKRNGVISEGEIYLEAGEKFTIPEGKWTVDGDETVYYGGTVFYASKEGMYTFKKK